ncbi:ATP-binding protein [Anaeromassilibacillus senegalensis]|uniref:ATP-binding protein n=1 Tax=Anaeromassilibacillus senegalensis TaxID=1673717 RepID=UPI000AB9793E|nr:ATP-binding protein [Anaeromassilibacillus senegalensis]
MIGLGYSKEVYLAASAALSEQKSRAEAHAERHRTELYSAFPRAQEIEKELSATAISAAKAVLKGGNTRELLSQLKERNQALQQELNGILQKAGLPKDYLEPHYACSQCCDTGYIDGRTCSCLKKLLRSEAYKSLNTLTPLSLCTFETFDLRYYSSEPDSSGRSERGMMARVLDICMTYAENVSAGSSNLIMMGGTGLGKTHLSLAIANAAIEKGFGVVYGSVNNMIAKLEREHFGREQDLSTGQLLLDCDLLILDDLGTEFRTAFAVSEIYNIVNTRQMAQRPTIISTNLTMKEIEERYTERFASRILGGYVRLPFTGKDVRLQKRMRQIENT